MNHSIRTADRTTHLKIVAVALAGALAVVWIGIAARTTSPDFVAAAKTTSHGPVQKARPLGGN